MNNRIPIEEIKKIQIELLDNVVGICIKNNLKYYLAGGTLLGAVRHKGFIPWDDDIDILMPRPDYMKLIEILNKEDLNNTKLLSQYTTSDYYYTFAKIVDTRTKVIEEGVPLIEELGVNIDIFPIDGIGSSEKNRDRIFKKVLFYRRLLYVKLSKYSFNSKSLKISIAKTISYFVLKLISHKYLLNKIDKLATRFNYEESDYIGCIVSGYGYKEIFSNDIFGVPKQLEFEKKFYNVPNNYDKYLRRLYDNYMQFPPKEKRITHHKYLAYWKVNK